MLQSVVRLKWPKCIKGYDIVRVDPLRFDWRSATNANGWTVEALAGAEAKECQAIKRWGMNLQPLTQSTSGGGLEFDATPFEIIEPIGEASRYVELKNNLYVEFSSLGGSSEKIIDFANKHGLLHDNRPSHIREWCREIRRMENAVRAANKAKSSRAAMAKLISHINEEVQNILDNAAMMTPILDQESKGISLVLRPNDLLSAMWLQLMSDVAGEKTFAACSECNRIMLLAPGVNRSSRKTCGPTCRKRASRRRLQKQEGNSL